MAVSALGIGGEFTPVLWQNSNDMPPIFPNADTLGGTKSEQIAAIQQLVEARSGKVVAVKDSWAQLDLKPFGFEVIFEADWLYREVAPLSVMTPDFQIERVTTAEGLREFALACNGADIPVDVYSPKLLDNRDIVWLVGKQNGTIVTGATAVRAQGLNGINNVLGETTSHKEAIIRAAVSVFADLPACGWETEDSIAPYLPLGFQKAGKLQVWLKSAE